jgi:hypothetical protein
MAPRKYPTIAPAEPRKPEESGGPEEPKKKYPQPPDIRDMDLPAPERLITGGPKEGTLARNLWLEQQAAELADAIKEQVKTSDAWTAYMMGMALMEVIVELASIRRTTRVIKESPT